MAKGNAVQAALNRANPEQKARNEQVINQARATLGDAKMKHVEGHVSPLAPRGRPRPVGLDKIEPSPETRANIESISRAQGNKALYGNAVDKAMSRQAPANDNQTQKAEKQQGNER
jgi:hypothetical protein